MEENKDYQYYKDKAKKALVVGNVVASMAIVGMGTHAYHNTIIGRPEFYNVYSDAKSSKLELEYGLKKSNKRIELSYSPEHISKELSQINRKNNERDLGLAKVVSIIDRDIKRMGESKELKNYLRKDFLIELALFPMAVGGLVGGVVLNMLYGIKAKEIKGVKRDERK